MAHRYQTLLTPLVLPGGAVLKNRMVQPKCAPDQIQGPEEWPSEQFIHFHREMARRGNSLIVVCDADRPQVRQMPAEHDFAHSYSFDLGNPAVHNYFCQLCDDVHGYGSRVTVMMMPGFGPGVSLGGGSAHHMQSSEGFMTPPPSRPATHQEIRASIDAFVQRCRLYQSWGFDAVSIGAVGLDPETDLRTDEYGGSPENRCRYTLEMCQAVKKACGEKFILCLMHQYANPYGGMGGIKNGYSLEDTITLLRLLEAHRAIDLVQVREQSCVESHPTGFTFRKGEHKCLSAIAAIKAAGVTIPLAAAGGFQDPDEMEGLLASGACDLISIGRGQFTDGDYLTKIMEERGEDIRPCVKCNRCHGRRRAPWTSVCTVNPTFGVELKLRHIVQPVGRKKKVAVIGGGPAGMQAAITCAGRGHSVVLFEASGQLGGQLRHSDHFSFKWPFKEYRLWLERMLGQKGVEVRLNTVPAPEDLENEGFDAILAATGSKAKLPDIPGMRKADGTPALPTCHDVIGHEAELPEKLIMVGCSETGIETACYLAEHGHDVTCLTRQDKLAKDASPLHSITIARMALTEDGYGWMAPYWEGFPNIHGVTNATTTAVTDTAVTYRDREGAVHTLEAEAVIVCGGVEPCLDSALRYASAAPEFRMIGDTDGATDMQTAVRSAYIAASQI